MEGDSRLPLAGLCLWRRGSWFVYLVAKYLKGWANPRWKSSSGIFEAMGSIHLHFLHGIWQLQNTSPRHSAWVGEMVWFRILGLYSKAVENRDLVLSLTISSLEPEGPSHCLGLFIFIGKASTLQSLSSFSTSCMTTADLLYPHLPQTNCANSLGDPESPPCQASWDCTWNSFLSSQTKDSLAAFM
jgi:hypothetical protein